MTTNSPSPGDPDFLPPAPPYPSGPPPGYGPPQGYGPAQSYGPPQGYGPAQSYGTPQGYGPPPNFGAQPAYGPPPGYGPPQGYQAPPSSATAIIAAVLAFLGALSATITVIADIILVATFTDYDGPGWFSGYAAFEGVVALVRLGVLVAGGVLLLRRRTLGRTLILVGCALAIIMAVVAVIVVVAASVHNVPGAIGSGFGTVLGLAFPIATAVLLLVTPTTRWLKSA